jgi:hypothetical protein
LNGCSDHAGSDSEVVALFVKLRNPLEELTIPNIEELPDSPQLRAQYAALVRMSMPRDISEISSRKIWMMGSGVNFTLSCEFAIFKGGGKTDSKFGLVIKQNSLYKSILASDTLLQMIEDLNGTERPLVNSPLNLMENKWYKITAKISGNQIIAELCGEKLYSSVTYAEREALGAVECGISIECGENVSIAFKNFKFEKLESIGQSIDSVGLACNHQIWIWQTLLIIATLKLLVFLALVSHTKKRCYKR